MKPFSLCILGSGSAAPTKTRNLSAHVVNIHDSLFLIDCAEGCQMQIRKYGIKGSRIHHIFISHLHGDHYLGLMGLLFTSHLFGRTEPMHIYAPAALLEIIDLQLKHSNTTLLYPLIFHELMPDVKSLILETKKVDIYAFPLQHRIPCWGFLFREKANGIKINKEFIALENPDIDAIKNIKAGGDYINKLGLVFKNEVITQSNLNVRSYAYCSDTIYDENIIPFIENTTLLYHEATLLDDMAEIAKQKFHTTAKEAAIIAGKANVKQLLIGHFSARYDDASPLLNEAREYFPNTIAAEDGMKVEL
ncbi:MAG: ribonuclease Z [Bacteroidetes bacterium]|nr:ribonuclease Z [Bacteroidota bacterium]